MSDDYVKSKRSRRIEQKENHMARQWNIAKAYSLNSESVSTNQRHNTPHSFHKRNAMNCGNPNCVMCMNPRKAWNEKTMQEKKFEQKKLHEDYVSFLVEYEG